MRFFILSSHYRSPINYCDKGMRQADSAPRRLYMALRGHENAENAESAPQETWRRPFALAMNDDFNTPRAIGVMFDLAHALNTATRSSTDGAKVRTLATTLRALAAPLGLLQADPEHWLHSTPAQDELGNDEAQEIVTERIKARGRKDWTEADRLRNILTAASVSIEDSSKGTKWYRTR